MLPKAAGAALAALVLALAAPPAPAAGAPGGEDGGDRLARGAELLAGAGPSDAGSPPGPRLSALEPTFGFTDVHCVADPPGDTFLADGDERVPFEDARADLRAVCADYGEELRLRLRVQDPADPSGWQGETGAYWYLDTDGDGDFERAVAFEAGASGPRALVAERAGDGGWQPLEGCDVDVAVDAGSGEFVTSGLDLRACVHPSAPPRIAVGGIQLFETGGGEVVHDVTEVFATGRSGSPTLRTTRRLAGADRYATAVAISQARFGPAQQPPAAAYLARADGFADALAAGSLDASAATSGPILLVPSCGDVPGVVLSELDRLDPPEVVALGGEAAVCDGVLAQVEEAGGGRWETARLSGGPEEPTRWGTAVEISRQSYLVEGVEEVYLATGDDFPDALAAGSLDGGPLLLVPGCGTLPAAVRDEVARLEPGRIVALGGQAAVCDDVVAQAVEAAEAAGGEPLSERLSGPTRLDTAAEVSTYQFPDGDAATVFVARADDFPDALAGATLRDGPILLVPRCGDLPPAAAREIGRIDPGEVVALGGGQAVCDQTLRHAGNA